MTYMKSKLYIGTSGWHYNDWLLSFYPKDVTGYNELKYHSEHFNTVENNSSFYRISKESTYKTWSRMVPEEYVFSMKLNKSITHIDRLELTDTVRQNIEYILSSTQVLQNKLGAIVIQLPPSFRYDLEKVSVFLDYFMKQVQKFEFRFNVAIEFRHKSWFVQDTYDMLKTYNVALVASQSSRYPEAWVSTADFTYIRMHGPEKLFSSTYSTEQLEKLGAHIRSISPKMKRIYVYFNNDFHGYALENAKELIKILK
jgi:uncharacterized protein YecE (DUF72 family)